MENLFVKTSGGVCVAIVFDVGSVNEDNDQRGMAHVVEHMAFKTAHCLRENDFGEITSRHGAKFNAWTSFKNVGFYVECERSNVVLFAKMLISICFGAVFRDEELQREVMTVLDECNRRENNFQTTLWKLSRDMAGFCKIKHDPIGTLNDIVNMNASKLQTFYDALFTPDKAVMVLAAPEDVPELRTLELPRQFPELSILPGARVEMRTKNGSCDPVFEKLVTAEMPDILQPVLMYTWSMPAAGRHNMDVVNAAFEWINMAMEKNIYSSFMKVKYLSPVMTYEWIHPDVIAIMLVGKYECLPINYSGIRDVIKKELRLMTVNNVQDAWRFQQDERMLELKHNSVEAATTHGVRFWDSKIDNFTSISPPTVDDTRRCVRDILTYISDGTKCRTVVITPSQSHYSSVTEAFQRHVEKWESRKFETIPPEPLEGGCFKDTQPTTFDTPTDAYDETDMAVHVMATPDSFWFIAKNRRPTLMFQMLSIMNNLETTFFTHNMKVFMDSQSRLVVRDTKHPKRNAEELEEIVKGVLRNVSLDPRLLLEWKNTHLEEIRNHEMQASTRANRLVAEHLWGVKDDFVSWLDELEHDKLGQDWEYYLTHLDRPEFKHVVAKVLDNEAVVLKEPNVLNPTQCVVLLAYDLNTTLDSEDKVHSIMAWQDWLGAGFGSVLYNLREKDGLFYSLRCKAVNFDTLNPKGSSVVLVIETVTHPSKCGECVSKVDAAVSTPFTTDDHARGLVSVKKAASSTLKYSLNKTCCRKNAGMCGWDFDALMRVSDGVSVFTPKPVCKAKIIIGSK